MHRARATPGAPRRPQGVRRASAALGAVLISALGLASVGGGARRAYAEPPRAESLPPVAGRVKPSPDGLPDPLWTEAADSPAERSQRSLAPVIARLEASIVR